MQDGYPVMLKIRGTGCVIVGGGRVAARKIGPLLEAGARVTIISPDIHPAIRRFEKEGRVVIHEKIYEGAGDLRGAALVFAATDREEVNALVYRDAVILGILVCDTGHPDRSTFHLPAVLRRGRLVLAVSTSGASPSAARRIRDELSAAYGSEYEDYFDFLAELRQWARRHIVDPAEREAVLKDAANRDFLGLIRQGRFAGVRKRLLAGLSGLSDTAKLEAWRQLADKSGVPVRSGEMET